jgi:IstB-like ATP binding protein
LPRAFDALWFRHGSSGGRNANVRCQFIADALMQLAHLEQEICTVLVDREVAELVAMVITTKRAYKYWSQIFNNDSLNSAILDRVLHHVDTVVIEGKSFRTKEGIDE